MTDRELDLLIEGYIAEPAPELEQRVLARVRRRPLRWLALAGVAAAAAGLALVWQAPAPPRVARPPVSVASAEVRPAPGVSRGVQKSTSSDSPRRLAPGVSRGIRKPTALTPQESQLLLLAQTQPKLAEHMLVEAPKHMAEPLKIEPLVVEPLAIKSVAE